MTYSNSYHGIEKIHTAEILLIIATLIEGFSIGFYEAIIDKTDSTPIWIILSIFIIASVVLTVVSKILNLRGLKIASADSKLFMPAFYLSFGIIAIEVFLLIVYIVEPNIEANKTINSVFVEVEEIEEIVEFIQMIIVMVVVKKLAQKLNGTTLIKFINIIKTLIIIIIAISLLAGVFSMINEDLSAIMKTIAIVLELASFVLYLIFVDKTVKFLKDN
ncbi:MAG: hypothetical protein K5644_04195 [Lachnospiraceae bacterium]|nr:hypothetical protein [Lachnospiraceae bacterium]